MSRAYTSNYTAIEDYEHDLAPPPRNNGRWVAYAVVAALIILAAAGVAVNW